MPLYSDGQIINDINLNSNGAQVDNTVVTGTFTSVTAATKLWDMPANTTQVKSAFRLTAVGQSVVGTTATNINWGIGYGPNAATSFVIDNESQPASSTWYFTVIAWLVVSTSGSSGQAYLMGNIAAGQIPNNSVANWVLGSLPVSWNTTVDNKLCINCWYNSSTGSPVTTVSCSVLERLG